MLKEITIEHKEVMGEGEHEEGCWGNKPTSQKTYKWYEYIAGKAQCPTCKCAVYPKEVITKVVEQVQMPDPEPAPKKPKAKRKKRNV